MFDGMARELTEVKYFPQMFVGAVESKGLKVTLENGILKVTKESIVIMKGSRNKILYYVKGSTVTGVLKIAVDSDEDATKL